MPKYSQEHADAILLRAAQNQVGSSDSLSFDELKQAALAAGIGHEEFALAVADVSRFEVKEKNSGQKGFGQRIGKLMLYTIGAAWVAIAVAILAMGGKYSFLCVSYSLLIDKVEPHLDAASSTTKFAAEEIDLALEKFEGHMLWRNTLNQRSNEAKGFWQRAFSPPADPALVRFHRELTELAEKPVPNSQEAKQLIEDYRLNEELDEEYRLVDTPFRSQVYWQAASDADDMGFLFFVFSAITLSFSFTFMVYYHASR